MTSIVVPVPPPREVRTIQAARAIAASSVVLFHIPGIAVGGFGVEIFFCISGFIIGLVTDGGERNFFAKRVFRIAPLYWLATLAVFAVAVLAPKLLQNTRPDAVELAKSLLFVPFYKAGKFLEPVLFLGWTLNCEMMFYAVFAICLLVSQTRAWIMTIVFLAALVAIGQTLRPGAAPLALYSDPVVLEFCAGVVLFRVWKMHHARMSSLPVWALSAGIIGMLAAMSAGELMNDGVGWVIRGVAAFAFVAFAISAEGRIAMPAWLLAIGDASYSLYLLHPYIVLPVSKIIAKTTGMPQLNLILAPVTLAVCIGVALLSYRYIERPSNRWLRGTFLGRAPAPVAG